MLLSRGGQPGGQPQTAAEEWAEAEAAAAAVAVAGDGAGAERAVPGALEYPDYDTLVQVPD